MSLPVLAVTSGEPAGIGPDICLDLAFAELPCRPVVLGDKDLLVQRAEMLGKNVVLRNFVPSDADKAPLCHGELEVLHIPLDAPCEAGMLNRANARYVLQLLDTAYQGITEGIFDGMVTAPLHKGIINDAGAGGGFFSGHTEYLAEKSQTEQVVMMLAGDGLRVALVTTHLPLRAVADAVTQPLVESVVRILNADLRDKFGIAQPHILVTGLNPHAGEGGHLGHEEAEIITPARTESARGRKRLSWARGNRHHAACRAQTARNPRHRHHRPAACRHAVSAVYAERCRCRFGDVSRSRSADAEICRFRTRRQHYARTAVYPYFR